MLLRVEVGGGRRARVGAELAGALENVASDVRVVVQNNRDDIGMERVIGAHRSSEVPGMDEDVGQPHVQMELDVSGEREVLDDLVSIGSLERIALFLQARAQPLHRVLAEVVRDTHSLHVVTFGPVGGDRRRGTSRGDVIDKVADGPAITRRVSGPLVVSYGGGDLQQLLACGVERLDQVHRANVAATESAPVRLTLNRKETVSLIAGHVTVHDPAAT